MIRVTCGQCGKVLRAGDNLAGKRGKCAHCGAINRIPRPAVNVEVKRAEPSPFRSTADVAIGPVIVESGAPPAVVSALSRVPIDESRVDEQARPAPEAMLRNFFDHVAERMSAGEPHGVHDDDLGLPPAARQRVEQQVRAQTTPRRSRAMHDSAEVARWIAAALAGGAVLGFCLGLIASKWIL